jgi:hypothetical protein
LSLIVPGSVVTAACGGKPEDSLIGPAPGVLADRDRIDLAPSAALASEELNAPKARTLPGYA